MKFKNHAWWSWKGKVAEAEPWASGRKAEQRQSSRSCDGAGTDWTIRPSSGKEKSRSKAAVGTELAAKEVVVEKLEGNNNK